GDVTPASPEASRGARRSHAAGGATGCVHTAGRLRRSRVLADRPRREAGVAFRRADSAFAGHLPLCKGADPLRADKTRLGPRPNLPFGGTAASSAEGSS